MRTLNISLSSHTKSLLIALYSSNNDYKAAMELVNPDSDEYISSYMFSSAIAACGTNWQFALELLQRACNLNKADEAVFTATAKCCAKNKKYLKSFRIFDAMLSRKLEMNKYSFSFIINACLEYEIQGEAGEGRERGEGGLERGRERGEGGLERGIIRKRKKKGKERKEKLGEEERQS